MFVVSGKVRVSIIVFCAFSGVNIVTRGFMVGIQFLPVASISFIHVVSKFVQSLTHSIHWALLAL